MCVPFIFCDCVDITALGPVFALSPSPTLSLMSIYYANFYIYFLLLRSFRAVCLAFDWTNIQNKMEISKQNLIPYSAFD